MPIGQSGLCQCCEDHAMIVYDEPVIGEVCADCKVQLRWAQAHLKTQKLIFCRPDMEWRESSDPQVLAIDLRDGRDAA